MTLAGMVAPDALIMRAMGWTTVAHLSLAGGWAVISTALVILARQRHRRPELRKYTAVATLLVWIVLGVVVLGTSWNVRVVIAVLLVLPGVNYLLLEAVGLTPKPSRSDPPLP